MTSDAGSGDAAGDGADGGVTCLASYELCDGFESGSFAAVWTPGPNVTLDNTVAHRGTTSVHVHSPAIGIGVDGYFQLQQTATLALGDPTIYVRAWVRLGSMPLNNMGFIAVEQMGTPDNEDSLTVRPTDLAVYSQFSQQSNGNHVAPPLNTWFCVLWTVTRSTGTTGSIMLAGDPPGVPLNSVQTDDASSPIKIMDFGIAFSGSVVTTAQPALDLWVDDVIVNGSAVTCAD
jgi:hypothetical protein